MNLDFLTDKLMLGLTPSPTSLERRIRIMQNSSGARSGMLVLAALGAVGLVAIACATNPPAPSSVGPVAQTSAAEPRSSSPVVDHIDHLQKAASQYYGSLPLNTTGEQRLLWFVFRRDWTVERHAIGIEDAVAVPDSEIARVYGQYKPATRPWSVNASLERKFPDLSGLGMRDGGLNISDLGGGLAVLGADTVSVFWARYTN